MGLIMKQQGGGAKIPPGEKLRFGIRRAEVVWGEHGPQAKRELEVLTPGEYKGITFPDWSKLAQPRTDFVNNLRKHGHDDEKIAEILRQNGYRFSDIDEPEADIRVGQFGKEMNINLAVFKGDAEAIDSFESVEELLAAGEGRSFVSITKARGADGKYTGVTWDMIYPDNESEASSAAEDLNEEDFDDIPF